MLKKNGHAIFLKYSPKIDLFLFSANYLNQGTHIVTIEGKTPTTTSSGLGRPTNLNYLLILSNNNK
jgi:hypothetical protein